MFSGLDQPGLSGADNPGANGIPPDSTGAVGPSDYVEIVNSEIRVYSRSGLTPVDPSGNSGMSLTAFINRPNDDVFDVQVQWDPQGGRWFYSAADCTPSTANPPCGLGSTGNIAIGWSKTADPSLGNWCHSIIPISPSGNFGDFPHLGHDNTQLIVGYNLFPLNSSSVTPPAGAQLTVVPKPSAGDEASCPPLGTATNFGPGSMPTAKTLTNGDGTSMAFSPIPAGATDNSAAGFVLAARDPADPAACPTGACANLTLWTITDNAGTPVLSSTRGSDITVPGYTVPALVPQPGTADMVDPLDTRLTEVVAHADPSIAGSPETLWTQHGVADPNDPAARSVVRWYEVTPGSGSPHQTGTVSDPVNWVFNGAVSPAGDGADAALFFNEGGPSQLISVRSRGHAGADPPGASSGEITLGTSNAADQDPTCMNPTPDTPCRWGDYSGASPDPANTNVAWGTNELNLSSAANTIPWGTLNFAVSTSDQPPTATFNLAPATAPTGQPILFDGSPSADPDGSIASWRWSFGDGANGTGRQVNHAYARAGTYTVTLTVTDDHGLTGSTTHAVTISDRPPTAVIQPSPSTPLAAAPASFNGGASTDPDGAVTAWRWSFGDGSTGAGTSPRHTYTRSGTYTVSLTVTDDSGNSGTATEPLTVDPSCVVPHLKRKRLTKVRKLLRRAHCARGRTRRTRGARHKPARRLVVRSQRPPAGTVVPVRTRVSDVVRLARR